MNLDVYLAALTRQLGDAAALGGDDMVGLAERLATPLQSTARLVLQDALSDAMQELTVELAPGSAEMRLRGRDIAFVVNRPQAPPSAQAVEASAQAAEPATGRPDGGSGASAGDLAGEASDQGDQGDAGEPGTARISFRPPDRLKAQIEAAAEREGLSVNAYLVRTLTAALRPAAPAVSTAVTTRVTRRPLGGERIEGWVQ